MITIVRGDRAHSSARPPPPPAMARSSSPPGRARSSSSAPLRGRQREPGARAGHRQPLLEPLTLKPGRRGADINQDLHLLWPAEVRRARRPAPAEPQLIREVEGRGFTVTGSGRLLLRSRDRMQVGTIALGEPLDVRASYVAYNRPGGQTGSVTLHQDSAWTPRLADQLCGRDARAPAALLALIAPKARRRGSTSSSGAAGGSSPSASARSGAPVPGLFSLYYERRDRIVHLAREYSLLIANFGDSDHHKIEEITPATAVRRREPRASRRRGGGAQRCSRRRTSPPRATRVQFHYFTGRINWRPVVISALIRARDELAGVLMFSTDMSRRIKRRRRARRRFGAAAAATNGTSVPSRESLITLIRVGTPYDEVVAQVRPPRRGARARHARRARRTRSTGRRTTASSTRWPSSFATTASRRSRASPAADPERARSVVMIKPYTAVGLIPTVRGIRKRKDIKINLEHLSHLVKAASWLSSLDLPVRLIALPGGRAAGLQRRGARPRPRARSRASAPSTFPARRPRRSARSRREYNAFIMAQAKARHPDLEGPLLQRRVHHQPARPASSSSTTRSRRSSRWSTPSARTTSTTGGSRSTAATCRRSGRWSTPRSAGSAS